MKRINKKLIVTVFSILLILVGGGLVIKLIIKKDYKMFVENDFLMEPVIPQFSSVVVLKNTMDLSYERGDIVVFKPVKYIKNQLQNDLNISRIAGLEGETVGLAENILHINGKVLKEFPFRSIRYASNENFPLNKSVVVPKGYFFVLGDNTQISFDSRDWGFLPKENIVGKVFKVFENKEKRDEFNNEFFLSAEDKFLKEAYKLKFEKKYDEALGKFLIFNELFPNAYQDDKLLSYDGMVEIYRIKGDIEGMKEYGGKMLVLAKEMEEKNIEYMEGNDWDDFKFNYFLGLGHVYYDKKNIPEAIICFEKALTFKCDGEFKKWVDEIKTGLEDGLGEKGSSL